MIGEATVPDAPEPGTPYRVLARKYRPSNFDDLIGQEPMVRTLTNAFETGRIAQAWMLTGVRGVGKTTTARILARALNYETDEIASPTIHMKEPGVHCQAIMEGRHVDVVEMDAASHTGIDDIREIIAQVRYRPVAARYKVYIIDEVHMLSNQAFNGLLKTLEEPPEHVKFVFATTEIRKVPITVLSRCQRFDLRRVGSATLIEHLRRIAAKEAVGVEDEALRLVARAAEGSVRDALSLTDQAIAHGAGTVDAGTVRDMLGLADRVRVIDLFDQLMRGDAVAALTELRSQYGAGADPVIVLSDLADFTHLVTTLRYVPDAADDASLSPAEIERGLAFAGTLSVRTLGQVWQMLLKAIEEARNAASPLQAAEMALIRIAHAADLPSPDELVRLIRDGGAGALPEAGGRPSGQAVGNGPVPAASISAPSASAAAPAASAPLVPPAPATSAPPAQPAPAAESEPQRAQATQAGRSRLSLAPRGEPDAATAARASQRPDSAPQAPAVEIRSLEDLAALAEEKRDSLMRLTIRRYLRLVKLEPGRIEVAPTPEAPATVAGDLARRLHDWTGRRWVVTISSAEGAPTLEEAEASRREALVSDAATDPEVAAVLAAFPGSKIVEVRLRGQAEASVEAALSQLPDAPGDDAIFDDSSAEADDDEF